MHRAVSFLSSGSPLASTETCARGIIHLPVRVCWSALARVLSGEFRCDLGFEGGRAWMPAHTVGMVHSVGVLAVLVEEGRVWLVMGSLGWPAWMVILLWDPAESREQRQCLRATPLQGGQIV